MDTPVPPERGGIPVLYGARAKSINRRDTLAGIGLAAALPLLAATTTPDGVPMPARVKLLRWDGHATIVQGDTTIEISVQTHVEPFARASSRSWITRQGSWTARTMTIEPDAGYVERNGMRTPLPAHQTEHERQQYAIYGYMLEALAGAPLMPRGDGLPLPAFERDGNGLLREARYTVLAPEGGRTFDEHFTFEGLADRSAFWPRHLTLANPEFMFSLFFDTFEVVIA